MDYFCKARTIPLHKLVRILEGAHGNVLSALDIITSRDTTNKIGTKII